MRKESLRWGVHQKGCAITDWIVGRRFGISTSIARIKFSASFRCDISLRFARPCTIQCS